MPKIKTWERRLATAKVKHRPKLKDWARDGFSKSGNTNYTTFQQLRLLSADQDVDQSNIIRIDSSQLSTNEFITRFEIPSLPVVISNTNTTAQSLHSFTYLRKSYGSRLFKVGEDDEGYKVKVKLKYFLQYMHSKAEGDDSPLYVFDSSFDDDEVSKSILDRYSVPHYFPDDLFSLVGEKRRPPYRWFLIGPERSGTCVHTDPLGTSAWNTVIRGRKRWVLFPPETPRRIAKALDVIQKGEDDESINYFCTLLPRLRELQKRKQNGNDKFTMIEFTQYPGETVFVPGGWWHGVLNLDDTIAVTQNFCSRTNFLSVWKQTREGRKKMAVSWLKKLRTSNPELASLADECNAREGYILEGSKFKLEAAPAPAPAPADVPSGTSKATVDGLSGHIVNTQNNEAAVAKMDKHLSKSKQQKREKRRRLDSWHMGSGSGKTSCDESSNDYSPPLKSKRRKL